MSDFSMNGGRAHHFTGFERIPGSGPEFALDNPADEMNAMDMPIATDLVERAMHLSREDRAELALQLIVSLETDPPDENVEQEWAAEIGRRIAAYDRGEMAAIDADEAISKAEASLDRRGGNK